ncbi:MAG: PilN domain-containing protein [Desulfobacterales bacterium]|nr:PilN domain-containing protein [Desulfobacterales bacterium]
MTLSSKIDQLNAKVEDINAEIAKVERQAKKVDELKKELQKLNQKIAIIKNLEAQRKGAVRLLDDMTQMVAEDRTSSDSGALEGKESEKIKRLWFTSFQANGDDVKIRGIALDNKTVADFMTRLEVSKLFINVNLQRLQQQKIKNLNLKNFEISCTRAPSKNDEKDKK